MSILFQPPDADEDIGAPQDEKMRDILVFGYHCKLFRDDDKALSIDAGAHLIPWMGDASLKIDRYDGRGHLYDLSPYDSEKLGNISVEMTAEEMRIEKLCDEERYLELHEDLAEKAIQEEEEIKRLNQELAECGSYQAVGFSYDQQSAGTGVTEAADESNVTNAEDNEEEDAIFTPPLQLALPPSMTYPHSVKDNAVIEKTANFVSQHGGQMEIMIKTKQASNAQFAFLTFEHPLNPYYKHQVKMIKCGRYKPEIHNKQTKREESEDSDDADDSGYLHPSLRSSKPAPVNKPTSAPQLTASQLENTAYGQLIKKLGASVAANSPNRTPVYDAQGEDSGSQDYMAAQYEAYYSQQPYITQNYDTYQDGNMPSGQNYPQYASYEPHRSSPNLQSSQRPASPPADIKPLIERMLNYIVKDGVQFEQKVRDRKDSRFSFLNRRDPHHNYYIWRRSDILNGDLNPKGVSFSIKSRDSDGVSIDTKLGALPVDPESDEEGQEGERDKKNEKVYAEQLVAEKRVITAPPIVYEKPDAAENLQRKLAEQKLKDKLAAAAREKMTQVTRDSREKTLQAERKKKAAMFVTMLKNKSSIPTVHATPIGPELPPERLYSDDVPADDKRTVSHARESLREHSSRYRSSYSSSSSYKGSSRHHSPSGRHHSPSGRHHSPSGRHHSPSGRHRSPSGRHRSPAPRRHRRSPERSRRRRSPSPIVSIIKKKKTQSGSPPGSTLAHLIKKNTPTTTASAPAQTDSPAASGTSTPSPLPSVQKNKPDEQLMHKVREMLKANRKKVIEEDLFGD